MLNLETAFRDAQSYDALLQIANRATPRLSFLGYRYVNAEGYEGYLPIDALAKRVQDMVRANYDFTEEERTAGRLIATRIDQIYVESDEQVETANCFTRILSFIREMIHGELWPYATRAWWRDLDENGTMFALYTARQFQNVFERAPLESPNISGNHDTPPRWTAPQRVII